MTPFEKYINGLSELIHSDCVQRGWWDDPDRDLYNCLQLVSTEIAEATEGARKQLMDDHIEGFKMEEVEYADALIRVLDLGGKFELNYTKTDEIHRWCKADYSVGKQHLGLNICIIEFAHSIDSWQEYHRDVHFEIMNKDYCVLVTNIIQVAKNRGFSLWEAVEEKIHYNRIRADHSREARKKPGGKSW